MGRILLLLCFLLSLSVLTACKKVGERVLQKANDQLKDLNAGCEAGIKRELETLNPSGTLSGLRPYHTVLKYENNGQKNGEVGGKVDYVQRGRNLSGTYNCVLKAGKVTVKFTP